MVPVHPIDRRDILPSSVQLACSMNPSAPKGHDHLGLFARGNLPYRVPSAVSAGHWATSAAAGG